MREWIGLHFPAPRGWLVHHLDTASQLAFGRYSKDKPRMGDTLEIIKFLCKDFWQAVFRKQVDNLKTNHRVCQAWTEELDKLGSPRVLCSLD